MKSDYKFPNLAQQLAALKAMQLTDISRILRNKKQVMRMLALDNDEIFYQFIAALLLHDATLINLRKLREDETDYNNLKIAAEKFTDTKAKKIVTDHFERLKNEPSLKKTSHELIAARNFEVNSQETLGLFINNLKNVVMRETLDLYTKNLKNATSKPMVNVKPMGTVSEPQKYKNKSVKMDSSDKEIFSRLLEQIDNLKIEIELNFVDIHPDLTTQRIREKTIERNARKQLQYILDKNEIKDEIIDSFVKSLEQRLKPNTPWKTKYGGGEIVKGFNSDQPLPDTLAHIANEILKIHQYSKDDIVLKGQKPYWQQALRNLEPHMHDADKKSKGWNLFWKRDPEVIKFYKEFTQDFINLKAKLAHVDEIFSNVDVEKPHHNHHK